MGLKCPLLPELQFCLCGVIVNTVFAVSESENVFDEINVPYTL